MEKLENYAYSLAVALVALDVGAGGIAKLLGMPAVLQSFATLGLPAGTSLGAVLARWRQRLPSLSDRYAGRQPDA